MNTLEVTQTTIPPASIETVERRIHELLEHFSVLSLHDLCISLLGVADAPVIRATLARLIAEGEVQRQAAHRGIWFQGYALRDKAAEIEAIPEPFRAFLGDLTW